MDWLWAALDIGPHVVGGGCMRLYPKVENGQAQGLSLRNNRHCYYNWFQNCFRLQSAAKPADRRCRRKRFSLDFAAKPVLKPVVEKRPGQFRVTLAILEYPISNKEFPMNSTT